MKLSLEKKILFGFVINLLVVIASGWIFITRLDKQRDKTLDAKLDWIELSLFGLSIILLIIVYFIIRAQLRAKNISQNLLSENKQLLQSIIDNTSNPIFIKEINGEYLLINKQYESLFHISNTEIVGKTDHDFLPKEAADAYRNSDLEVVKALRELKTEETIEQPDGSHTYIAVKFPLYDADGRVYAIGGISTDITERKKLEESLKAADKFFNMSLDMMIIASDKFIKINPSVTKTLGYSEEELLSKPFLDFVYPDDIEITLNEVKKLQSGALTINFENRYICKDGSLKWILWSTSPDVSTGLLYAVAKDITRQKENEESLKMAEMFFNMSFDILAVAKGEHFIKINPALTKTLGYNQSDMDRIKFMDLIHPDDLKTATEVLAKHLEGNPIVNFRTRFLCKDGSYKWLDWNSNIDIKESVFYSVGRDVTKIVQLEMEREIATNELYQDEEKLRLIVENIGEGIIVANANKKIILANDMANELFGIKEDDKISSNFVNHFEVYFPDQKTVFPSQSLPMERAFNGESTDDIDVVLWDSSKQEKKRVLISGRPLVDQNDTVVAAVVTIKDISKYKQLEEELKESELKYRQLIGFKAGGEKKV
ncbi:PAS domain-containing protein [Flavobacterium limnophilum]|uniref:PAS domain-containing protein n=1 Tax=Flavobacterium limnophilum TaxID=3003262 RepID=UPI0024832625|nr:PAS domain S-box protein [Flavobacterium limnophilum]